jgi:glutamate-1-semialdehyde 2,1-aminomutase
MLSVANDQSYGRISVCTSSIRSWSEQDVTTTTEGRFTVSQGLFERAARSLAGGVSGDSKARDPHPLYWASASGASLVDVDGTRYTDYLLGNGTHILGHGPVQVREALHSQIDALIHPGLATDTEILLAEAIQLHMPHMERLRFANSGTEAVLGALRLSRAVTGRTMVGMFEGHYHGQSDLVMFSGHKGWGGEPSAPVATPDCAGLPQCLADDLLILPFNDSQRATELIDEFGDRLAAVIMEPLAAFGSGAILGTRDFLLAIREVCSRQGILLIWDEVVTGFRVALGGMRERTGISADLTVLGKIVGGGLPIGVFGGRADLMEAGLSKAGPPEKRIFASGTFTGNPLSMVAGKAVIDALSQEDPYPQLEEMSDHLRHGLASAGEDAGVPVQVTGIGSIFQMHFADSPVTNVRDARRSDRDGQKALCEALLMHGILLGANHPSFLSVAHDRNDIGALIDAVGRVLSQPSSEPTHLS